MTSLSLVLRSPGICEGAGWLEGPRGGSSEVGGDPPRWDSWLFFWSVSPVFFFGQDELLVSLQSALDRLGCERDTRGLGDEDGAGLVNRFSLFSGSLNSLTSGRREFNDGLGVSLPVLGERPGVWVQIYPGI